MGLKVGFVPEHFSTPLQFSQAKGFFASKGIECELIEYPSGSGHLIQSLKSQQIDIAVGLTEAFVRGICDGDDQYQIAGTYVKSPLCWAISTGVDRSELTSETQLQNGSIGVSRIGSGSYVMAFVLGLQRGFSVPFFKKFVILDNFKNLRDSVNQKDHLESSDAFMWEYFTSKKYYDNKEIKKIGQIYTPWSSWVVVSGKNVEKKQVSAFLEAVQDGIEYYNGHKEEAAKYIADNLDYSLEDAQEWQKTVEFSDNVSQINFEKDVVGTKSVLKTAGVIQKDASESDDLILQRLTNGVLQ
ncbi:hypothetical protein OGAPHI_000663 [Ogataea philodendri]|uniref:Ca3427-like PBP 2 domain-containing protein n=1 Tax=Ogataea philodendri TaxID=1378263 RepID=A0A9P8PF90_9ASCO|nr:uncharacterized protein OGAPHI_000663 [Ogataea philodendri]KAH3670952.1 hypothetical protein OGAPHI_000663 [Ogataea philodendri]